MPKITDDELRACVIAQDAEGLERMAKAIVGEWTQDNLEKLRQLGEGYPPAPAAPGLYAMIASDGVTVRIVDGRVTDEQIMTIVRTDITSRVLIDEQEKLFARSMSAEDVFLTMLPRYLAHKKLYHLEKLSP